MIGTRSSSEGRANYNNHNGNKTIKGESMATNIVDVEDLCRQFGNTLALDHVNYRAVEGKVYGLVGVNGAGKTTLIKHLLGLLRARSGSVRIFGQDPVLHPVEALGNIGYLSEERDLPEWMSIDQLMRYTQAYYPNWDNDYAGELLETFNLDRSLGIKNLSKGMRAQVGLVAAVAHRPRLLLLDEPSSGLDAVVREDILNAIVRTVSDEGRTVIFSSHLLEEVEQMSDHITMIDAGRVVLDGDLDSIKQRHQHSSIRFLEHQDSEPKIAGSLSVEGSGSAWNVIHETTIDAFRGAVGEIGGELIQSRDATLLEIFIARVGRHALSDESSL
jgi:ABC-2 type transport system ATP-binding protein